MGKAETAIALCQVLALALGVYGFAGGWMIAGTRFKVRALEDKIRRMEGSEAESAITEKV